MKRRTFLFALTAGAALPALAQSKPMKIGIIGSGRIGSTFGGLWAKAGHPVMFSDRDPALAGTPVHIRYQMHTNQATDVVRVSYATRELFTVSVGLLQFEPGTTESQEVQLSQRLRLRNLTH